MHFKAWHPHRCLLTFASWRRSPLLHSISGTLSTFTRWHHSPLLCIISSALSTFARWHYSPLLRSTSSALSTFASCHHSPLLRSTSSALSTFARWHYSTALSSLFGPLWCGFGTEITDMIPEHCWSSLKVTWWQLWPLTNKHTQTKTIHVTGRGRN